MAFSRATARAIVDIIDRNDFKLPLKLRTERIKDGISAHPEIHSQDDLIELLARTDELTIFSEISNLNLRYHNNVQLTIHFDLSPNGEFNFFEEELDPHDELGSLNFHFTRSYLGHGEEPPRYHVTTLPALLGLIKGSHIGMNSPQAIQSTVKYIVNIQTQGTFAPVTSGMFIGSITGTRSSLRRSEGIGSTPRLTLRSMSWRTERCLSMCPSNTGKGDSHTARPERRPRSISVSSNPEPAQYSLR